jgi:DNA helicase II / ATP-dependent DNA helicase PcrA
MLLLAGAGTGKTRVITYRVAYLIQSGIAPGNICAVTFTNKASREMRERLARLLTAEAADEVTVGTFHSFCMRLLRRCIRRLGYSPNFVIANDSYQTGLLRTIMSEVGATGEGRDPQQWLAHISRAKCAFIPPEELPDALNVPHVGELAEVYGLYQERMRQMDMVDFDDLLLLVQQLWDEHPNVLADHRDRFRYLLIDEYQDTNAVQFRLMATLAGKTPNICAVGDDDQSIYGWRGADLGNILQFESHFPNAKVIRLEQNYRSTTTILTAANHVIGHNQERHGKKLWSAKGEGAKILAVLAPTDRDEAQFVADILRERYYEWNRSYANFAVLFRSNHQSRMLENALRRAKVPYCLVGGRSFYRRKEILDVISLLDAVHNPLDDQSLLRIINVPPRGVGSKAIVRLREWQRITTLPLQKLLGSREYLAELPSQTATGVANLNATIVRFRQAFAERGQLATKIRQLLDATGYIEGLGRMYKPRADALARLDNVHEFLDEVGEFEKRRGPNQSLGDFLEEFALMDANDQEEEDAKSKDGSVTLMTIHAAKGLEFPVVLITGMERGLFPHERSLKENTGEEERRLFYVALTRAQDEVVLTYADRRQIHGSRKRRLPSPFLDELPQDLVSYSSPDQALKPASKEVATTYLADLRAQFAVD